MREFSLARLWGALCVAIVAWVIGRGFGGVGLGISLAAILGTLAYLYLPDLVISRVGWAIPMMAGLVFVSVVLMWMAPGSPFAAEKASDDTVIQELEERFGINQGPHIFAGKYLYRVLAYGDLGPSMVWKGRSVGDLLMPALPVSMSLGFLALIMASAIGLLLGIRAGYKPNSLTDYSSMGLALVGISLPNFVIGAFLMLVFSLGLGWFPVAGWGSFSHLVLPAFTLALPYAAYIARLARGGTIETMGEDYIRTARAKGVAESEVVMKHAFKQSLLPVVSFMGPGAANLMTGSFVVEILFGIPGMGQYFVKGAINRDYTVVLGTVLIYVSIIIVFNLLVDMAYAWLDPRVRKSS